MVVLNSIIKATVVKAFKAFIIVVVIAKISLIIELFKVVAVVVNAFIASSLEFSQINFALAIFIKVEVINQNYFFVTVFVEGR